MEARVAVPGKLFLLGEYGVIEGGSAFLCTLKPEYVYARENALLSSASVPLPESPLGRWLAATGRPSFSLDLRGAGLGPGFGSSTAELIAGAILADDSRSLPETRTFWAAYRERHPGMSGADLAVQLECLRGQGSCYRVSRGDRVEPVSLVGISGNVHVFQCGPEEKLKTHEDLARVRPPLDLARFHELVSMFQERLSRSDRSAWTVLDEFADFLWSSGRESAKAHSIRKTLRSVPGVLGVKGCGAGLNDVFVVALKDDTALADLQGVAALFGVRYLGALPELLA